VIRKTLTSTIAQIVKYDENGDKTLISANSSELKKLGWKMNTSNVPAAYLTGMLLAKKAKAKKINEAIVDLGLATPTKGSKIFAALKGAVDNGLNIPHSEDIFPSNEQVNGEVIKNAILTVKTKNQFSTYKKLDVIKHIKDMKSKIMK
jgi:large subunit ribosomal protein L18